MGKGAYARDVAKYLDDNHINYICIADRCKSEISWASLLNIINKAPTMVGLLDKMILMNGVKEVIGLY